MAGAACVNSFSAACSSWGERACSNGEGGAVTTTAAASCKRVASHRLPQGCHVLAQHPCQCHALELRLGTGSFCWPPSPPSPHVPTVVSPPLNGCTVSVPVAHYAHPPPPATPVFRCHAPSSALCGCTPPRSFVVRTSGRGASSRSWWGPAPGPCNARRRIALEA